MIITSIVMDGDYGSGYYSPDDLEQLERTMILEGIRSCGVKIYVFGQCMYDGIVTLDELKNLMLD